jgi:NADH:ubiquinone oxidoreductase subunit H
MPLGSKAVFLNSHLGILLLLALSSINVYGILISG